MKRAILILLCSVSAMAQKNQPAVVLNTIADLDLRYPLYQSGYAEQAAVRGFSVPGDWGEPKVFRYDYTNTLSTNAIRRAVRGGVGRWVHPWDGDVRVFGAVGDGVTDDTTAINAAIGYLIESSNDESGTLVFGDKTYVHSGITITPSRNFLLNIVGKSAHSASAVSPYGSRILLKAGSTNDLLKVNLSATYRLRLNVKNVYFDGNKDNAPSGGWVLRIDGDNSNYLSAGIWKECAFQRGATGGILLTNRVYAFVADEIRVQSNGGTGLWIDRGADHFLRRVGMDKNAGHGIYLFNANNVRVTDSDIAFSDLDNLKLQDVRGFVATHSDFSSAGQAAVEIAGASANANMLYARFSNCRIGSGNASTVENPQASGNLYPNLLLSGNGNVHYGHIFEACQFLSNEASDSFKPSYIIGDSRTHSVFTTSPGLGLAFYGCSIPSASSYYGTARVSSGVERYALWSSVFDHTQQIPTNVVNQIVVPGSLEVTGVATFGLSTNTVPAIVAQGGASGTAIARWYRPTTATTIDLKVATDQVTISSVEQSQDLFAGYASGGAPFLSIGGRSMSGTLDNATIHGVDSSGSGADIDSGNFTIRPGRGTGSSTNGGRIQFQTPNPGASGSTLQAVTTKVRIDRDGRIRLTEIATIDPAAGSSDLEGSFFYGVISGVTNWWFRRTNGWVGLP